MNLVKEAISFERKKDPKKALGLDPFDHYFNTEKIAGEKIVAIVLQKEWLCLGVIK